MRRIALRSILFDRGKLIASLLGVALASTLGFVQIGLYRGFEASSSTVIDHVGGDMWAMPSGLDVIDYSEILSVGPRNLLLSHPCVADVRAVLYGFAFVQRPSGTHSTALVTDGIRSFTLNPYLFTSPTNARRLLNVAENGAMYYAIDLVDKGCGADLVQWMKRQPDIQILDTLAWSDKTRAFWVGGSGAGAALAFTAILGLVVGGVIVGQTLYSMTKEHLLELATLKALGARSLELAGFVLWQVAFLAAAGVVFGLSLAFLLKHLLLDAGLTVVLAPGTIALGVLATLLMCVFASLTSLVAVIRLEAATVLR